MKRVPLLTVGIPAYNVESFIEETVSSVASSKYKDEIEILIINDGSTDRTLEVANSLSKKFACVKTINKKNGGHGSAINAAIQNASGKYFRLLDGDDWFDTTEFDTYLEKLKTEDSDMVLNDLVECFIKSRLNRPVSYYSNLPPYKKMWLDNTEFLEWGPMLPTTTIKTSILKNFKLKVDENCFYVDQEYNLACYLAAKTVAYYPAMIYQYRLEREGQSMEKASLIKNVESHERVCKHLLSIYSGHKKNMSSVRKQYIANRVIIPMCHMQYMIAIEWCKSRKHFLSFDKFVRKYPNFYHCPGVAGTLTKFHRKTKGWFIKVDGPLRKIANKKNQKGQPATSLKKRFLLFIGCLVPIAIGNAIIINYVNSEQTVHFWDTSGYWKNSINLVETFQKSKLAGFKTVANSLSTDYNLLPILPMVPFLSVFGTSRLSFVLIIFNLYVLPFAFFITKAIKSLFNEHASLLKPWFFPIVFSIPLLSPAVLIPVLNGRPDAICIFIISLIFYLIAKTKLQCISNYFALGFLVFLLILLRRYFCFWAISLYVGILIAKSISSFCKYSIREAALKIIKLTIKLCASGLFVLLLMLIFSKSLLVRYITGGYSDAYSAYMLGDFLNQINLFVRYYGLIFLIIMASGIVVVYIKYRKTKIGEFVSIGLLTSCLSFLLFTRVQTLGDQHMYMFVPFFVFCVGILATKLHTIKKIRTLSILPTIIVLCLSIFSFTGVRLDSCSNLCYMTGVSETVRPVVRHDIDEMQELSSDLESTMTRTDYVYVLSSSSIFNDDILTNLHLPLYPKYNISGVMHVDKRDGFPGYFFDATYVVVADPVQTHLSKGGQDVIAYLAEHILNGDAGNLTLIKTYYLDNGVQLKLYHKDSRYTEAFLRDTKDYFQNKYAEYPFLYETIPNSDSNN